MSLPFSRMFETSIVSSGCLIFEASLRASGGRRRCCKHPEMPREADLLVLGQCLVAEHDDEMFMPGVEDVGDRLRRQLVPKIDAENFGTERRRQWIYDEGGGIDERHGNSAVSSSNLAET